MIPKLDKQINIEENIDIFKYNTCSGILSENLNVCFRILELKNDMVLLEHSEYHYFDDVLSDLKLTPVCYKYFLS